MLTKLLIANRGAIACRILRTLRAMNIGGVAVYSEADISSLHIREADDAISLGDGPAANTYLVTEKLSPPLKPAVRRLSIRVMDSSLKMPHLPKPVKLPGLRLLAQRRNNSVSSA